jgi:hypothetical protein
VGVGLVLLLSARTAFAALGESAASVEADQLRAQGALRTVPMEGYTLHEIQTATGTVVREFASPAGAIFGVSWEGPFLPDLRQLLGSHYEAYAQAARAEQDASAGPAGRTAPRGRRPPSIRLPDLVVESSGHPRSFRGRAYVPRMLPEALRLEDLR